MSNARSSIQNLKKWIIAIAIAMVSWLIGWYISSTPPFRILELKVIDVLYELRGPNDVSESPVVLVAISDTSADELPEKWPWPTEYYARLIHNLNRAGAKVIVIDVIFDRTDIYNPANDTLFGEAMQLYGNVVLAGNVMTDVRRAFDDDSRMRVETRQLVQPNRVLRDYNPNHWGYVDVERDRDGFLRRYSVQKRHLEHTYYALGVQTLMNYFDLNPSDISEDIRNFNIGNRVIPKFSANTFMINYFGPESSFPEFDFSDVIDDQDFFTLSEDEDFQINAFDDPDFGLLQAGVFKDKIVIVGATMPELQDFYSTPYAPFGSMPGYETHANAINTILTGLHFQRVSNNWILFISFLFTVAIAVGTIYVGPVKSLIAVFFLLISVALTVWHLFIEQLWILEFAHLTLAIIIPYSATTAYGYIKEQRQKVRIQGMFGTYVSPDLVNRMVESGDEPKLGGEKTVITAFFSDIANFSTFSEKLDPERLVDLMNEYLSAMTDILIDNEGTLDKYIGDAIVAFWGAPIITKDHAYKACLASQLMIKRQNDLRDKWKKEEKWPEIVYSLQTRIGLNTGDVITGNMGSSRRFNYTMMGDNVNLAARCESGAKAYGVFTMITEQTRKEAEKYGDKCLFRKLDKIIVKGRSTPVEIHEIMGLKGDLKPEYSKCAEMFERGLEKYWERNWDEALKIFEITSKLEPYQPKIMPGINTNPSLIFLERCKEMSINPPSKDWDGVFVMKTK